MSEITRRYKRLSVLFQCLSLIVLIGPLAYYMVVGFIEGETVEKVTLGMTFIAAGILTVINVLFKYHIRSTIWILVLGIYFCLDSILPLICMIAVGTILDEFILTPLHKKYKNKAIINREIDRRTT